jgi:uncharacterized Zn-binding protein involved in type VI secretion
MKALILKDDPVDGTDTHNVSGSTSTSPPAAYTGTGDYEYHGAVTGGLSDFVTVNGLPAAVVTSTSALRADGAVAHQALSGSNFAPAGPNPATLAFTPLIGVGDGKPGAAAGSALLTIGGVTALLDGDPFDTCGIPGGEAGSTVSAKKQDFVTCSS